MSSSSGGGTRNLMHNVFHRLIGARGTSALQIPHYAQQPQQPQQGESGFRKPYCISSEKQPNFGHFYEHPAKEAAKHKIVFFGEIHSKKPIIAFQRAVQQEMAQTAPTLHVVFEHFSFEMQNILDDFQDGKLTFEELNEKYHAIGTESHNLEPYRKLLEDARELNQKDPSRNIKLHAGFLSRNYARMLTKEGEDKVLQEAAQWLPPNAKLEGSEQHYNIFENLLTGRPTYSDQKPDDRFRKIFQAQLLKDVAMAHKVNSLLEDSTAKQDDKLLVLAGNGHVLGYSGVPERVIEQHPETESDTCVIASCNGASLPGSYEHGEINNETIFSGLEEAFGPAGTNPADYIYLYYDAPPKEETTDRSSASPHHPNQQQQDDDSVKNETIQAYDKVGESAHYKGNMAKAIAIMHAMGYSLEQIHVAGDDAYNFQGVGNPHLHAGVKPGEVVLDIGSGLGLDTFIAHNAATKGNQQGFVVGIDISSKEVRHAQSCAQRRNVDDRVRFATADMEKIPLPDNSVDVIISNGAFCLVPNKEKAFREAFRVLKPGGRISICTTATRDKNKLEPGVSWPICMQTFISMKDIQPICERVGFESIFVDDSDSSMSIELPEDVMKTENDNPNAEKRSKVHVSSAEFSHLEKYDMDAICARVCIVAWKPDGEVVVSNESVHDIETQP